MCSAVCVCFCACIDLGLSECLLIGLCVSIVWEPTVQNQPLLCVVGGVVWKLDCWWIDRSCPGLKPHSLWRFSSPRYVTMTGQSVGCRWECRVFSIINSCCIGLPRSRQVLSVCVSACAHLCLRVFIWRCLRGGIEEWSMTIWQLLHVISAWVCAHTSNIVAVYCLREVFGCHASVPRVQCLWLWLSLISVLNKWETLDIFHFSSDKPNSHSCSKQVCFSCWCGLWGCSWEMTCHRHYHDSISSFPPDSDIQVYNTFRHGMSWHARVSISHFHTELSKLNKSKSWKVRSKRGGNLFPSTPPDSVYTRLHSDMFQHVGTNLHYLFHNTLLRPQATAQRRLELFLGKYAQVHSPVANRWYFLLWQVERVIKYDPNS